MTTLFLIFSFILGTIIGSFLNVVVLRYGTTKSSSRSMCFSCGKLLHWYELVPLLSYVLQRGRCRGCKSTVSLQYPLVELLTGLVFALVFWKQGFLSSDLSLFSYSVILSLVIQWVLWSLLIALSVYDTKHKIIPDGLVYTAAVISFLSLLLSSNFELRTSNFSIDFWSGFLFAAPFALIWFFSGGRAMGLGDAKLIVFFPWALGLPLGLSALIVGFWIGAAVSLGLLLVKASFSLLPALCPSLRSKWKHLGMKTELPLGPFLVLGLLLVYIFGWDVTGLSLLMQ